MNLDVYGIVFSSDSVLLFRQIVDINISRSKNRINRLEKMNLLTKNIFPSLTRNRPVSFKTIYDSKTAKTRF